MLIKFESKSNRVKGVSFHPKRPWVLSALHNGTVQLWDYRMGTLIDKFEEHDGPVRGVAFHQTQPLFVSGGDDYKIKVWNYKQRRCLFTLTGHLDYIRTVFFHHEYPWIISASDDQTIRIWNWQSRQCISILTGHNHYVMCAQFHPKEDLVVSASLDQTVRVWDFSGLRKKNSAPSSSFTAEDMTRSQQPNNPADIFGNTDVLVKYVLEGHERGVNWAAFHPTMPLIVSGADDRQVKLWRMSDTKAWEVDTCRGHYNNVSCALFHPRSELIISNSEDKTIRVWDMSKRSGVQTFRRENERFWVIASHPSLNLFAAGHDAGMIVFKLERERPAFTLLGSSTLLYVKDKQIRMFDFQSGADGALLGVKKHGGLNTQPRTLSFNPADNTLLLTNAVDGGCYELYQLPKSVNEFRDAANDCKTGAATAAVFVARNRFVLFNKPQQVLNVHTVGSESVRSIYLTGAVNDVFYAGTGQVLLTSGTTVSLYDLQQQASIAEIPSAPIRYAFWNADMSMVALLGKHSIIIANKKLEQIGSIHETIRIKSGAWDDCGVFIYSTLNHIKYVLPQGDNGIIRTLDHPLYLVKATGSTLHCLDRDAKVRLITIEPAEYRFKLALIKRQYEEVLHMIRNSNLVGQSIIAYLRNKGYPEVALHFVRDPQTRFDLALECGNLAVGTETATQLDSHDCWTRLAAAALRQGHQQTVEMAYQRVQNFERLSFLYLITGQQEKLRKMGKIAELRNDLMSQYQNALFTGDVEEQIRVYRQANQHSLAYWAAKVHGLEEVAAEVLSVSGKQESEVEQLSLQNRTLLSPPTATLPAEELQANWPQLTVSRGIFETAGFILPQQQQSQQKATKDNIVGVIENTENAKVVGDWGDDDLELEEAISGNSGQKITQVSPSQLTGESAGGGWDIDDVELVDEAAVDASASASTEKSFELPAVGASAAELWVRNSQNAVDHIAAGSFETAMQILNRQLGICQFGGLKEYFMTIYQSAQASIATCGQSPALDVPIYRNWQQAGDGSHLLPLVPFKFQSLLDLLRLAYEETTAGRFAGALDGFVRIIRSSIFTTTSSHSEAEEMRQLVNICREYVLGLKMEMARKELPAGDASSVKRNVELAAYFTHCDLQPTHNLLSLQVCMTQAYKAKCFATTALMIRRLLELGPNPQLAQKARQIQAIVEKNLKDDIQLAYEPLNPFNICASTFTPIYKGTARSQCQFCAASYRPELEGKLCSICGVAQIRKSS